MTSKHIDSSHSTDHGKHKHHLSPGKIFLYLGIFILFSVLLYMVADEGGGAATMPLWIPFIMAGVALLLTSKFIR